MAKTDWDSVAKLFAIESERTGVSAKDWCEQNGYNYQSARRYLKTRAQSPSNKKDSRVATSKQTKSSKKTAQTAQKPVRKSNAQNNSAQIKECANAQIEPDVDDDVELGEPDNPEYKGRDEKGRFVKGEYEGNPNPSYSFPEGHQINRTHGGYAKYLRIDDLEVGDESEIVGLIAERRMFRARIASALRTIFETEQQLSEPETTQDPELVAVLQRLIRQAEKSIEISATRVESLTKTISSIRIDDVTVPHRIADEAKVKAQTEKLKAETDKLGRKSGADSVLYQLDW